MIIKTVSYQVSKKIKQGIIRIGSLQYYKEIEDKIRRDSSEGIPDKLISGKAGTVISAEEFNKVSDSVGGKININAPIKLIFAVSEKIETNAELESFINSNNKYKYDPDKGKLILKGQMTDKEYFTIIQCYTNKTGIEKIDNLKKKSINTIGNITIQSDYNIHVFCAYENKHKSVDSNNKFGNKIFKIKNLKIFSKLIANHLLLKYKSGELKTNGDFDSISFGDAKVTYTDIKSDKDYVTKSKDGLPNYNMDAVFTKPIQYVSENEHRFVWFPYSNDDNTSAPLAFGHKYIDLYIKDLDRYIEWVK